MLLSTEGERENWRGEPPMDSASGEKALRRFEGLRFLLGAPECEEDMLPRLRLLGIWSWEMCGGEAMVAVFGVFEVCDRRLVAVRVGMRVW